MKEQLEELLKKWEGYRDKWLSEYDRVKGDPWKSYCEARALSYTECISDLKQIIATL